MEYKLNRAWAEVNLDFISYNVSQIKKLISKKTEIMGVVKADAYGHGVNEVVKVLLESGVSRLAVSMLDEGIQLRKNGVKVPILILSYTDPRRAEEIIQNNLIQTVFSHELAESLSETAVKLNKNVKIHIKIDTGMTRVGFMPGYSAVRNVEKISKLKNIIIEGLYTHFASADENDSEYTYMQYDKFMSICNELKRIGIIIPVRHIANSAAIVKYPEMHLEMIRAGIILYGLYPSKEVDKTLIDLRPAMSLKANVILVKDVEAATEISYGRKFVTKGPSKIATIPIGYADGYTRLMSGKGMVIVAGYKVPIVGNICMDQCMIDITGLKEDVKVGDEVVLFGKQGNAEIHVDEIAAALGTINYEIVSVVGKRIPRVFKKNGEIYNVLNYLI